MIDQHSIIVCKTFVYDEISLRKEPEKSIIASEQPTFFSVIYRIEYCLSFLENTWNHQTYKNLNTYQICNGFKMQF